MSRVASLVSKTVSGSWVRRGFKSLPLRFATRNLLLSSGFRMLDVVSRRVTLLRSGPLPTRGSSAVDGPQTPISMLVARPAE